VKPVKLVVIGLGSMGGRHVKLIHSDTGCELVGVCDSDSEKRDVGDKYGVPFFNNINTLIEKTRPKGAIIATPSAHHAEVVRICSRYGVHVLIEKPMSNTPSSAQEIVDLSKNTQIKVLVGHHRRYNSLVQTTREIISSGKIGNLAAVSMLWTLMKPTDYFDVKWRTLRPDGGPVMINLVHELDSLRYLCGEITQVFAHLSSTTRGFDVEDSASISLNFESGAVGSVLASETVASPWSYESTSGENPLYFHTNENCYYFLGTLGSLAFPQMHIWSYMDPNSTGWQHELTRAKYVIQPQDALTEQLRHFCEVVRGNEHPLVDAQDGAQSLKVALAVIESADKNRPITLI
tara:strand:+ start:1768 stop:2811 length:1044 start_codon:yes stop_codon:yes gene_type:complete